MGILYIGIGLLVGILAWFERPKTLHKWMNHQERRHFEEEQKERECRAVALYRELV